MKTLTITSMKTALPFACLAAVLALSAPLPAGAVQSVRLDGGGGGGGGGGEYYENTDIDIPEITPTDGADVDITTAVNGNGTLSSYQWTTQVNKTLWYAWNRWASGCNYTTGCLPSSDTSTQGWVTGLSNPSITIGYDVGVYDAATNAPYAENANVPVGSQIKLVFGAYVPNNIFWFGTGYSMDSPFGEWRTNAAAPARVSGRVTCESKDYVVKYHLPGYGLDFDVYIPFVVHPPARSISVIPAGLSCGALANNSDGTASMTCTVTGTGTLTPRFHFDATYGKFYYRYYDERTQYVAGCYGNNIPMTDSFGNATTATYNTSSSMPAGYQVAIPAKDINFPITAVPSNNSPAAPSMTCPTTGQTGQALTFTATATDPDGDTLRYGFDWVNAGTVNEWSPATGYVTSGTQRTVTHTWNQPGTYVVGALAEDSKGGKSSWSSCSVQISAPPPSISCSATPSTVNTNQSATFNSSVSGGSGNYTYSWSDSGGTFGSAASASKSYSSSGTKTITLAVTDIGAPPSVTFSASPTSIYSGNSATLTWSSTNATSCAGTGFSTGGATSGSASVSPSATTNYTVNCTGPGGTTPKSASVTVSAPPTPSATLSASPASVGSGGAATLTWSSANAASCSGTNFSTNGATAGSVTVNPLATTQYTVTCGTATNSKTVTVVPAPTATISKSPSTAVVAGTQVVISWSSTNANSCTGTNFSTGNATSGSVSVYPSVSTTYGVTCNGTGGTAAAGTTVSITTGGGGGGGGGGGCFAPETLVRMAGGSLKPISEVKVGDWVMSEDESGNRLPNIVTETFVHEGGYDTLVVNGTLVVTPNHPMRASKGGVMGWYEMGELAVGDSLILEEAGTVVIESIEEGPVLPAVYNLEVFPTHTYFAGGYLVHNKVDTNPV